MTKETCLPVTNANIQLELRHKGMVQIHRNSLHQNMKYSCNIVAIRLHNNKFLLSTIKQYMTERNTVVRNANFRHLQRETLPFTSLPYMQGKIYMQRMWPPGNYDESSENSINNNNKHSMKEKYTHACNVIFRQNGERLSIGINREFMKEWTSLVRNVTTRRIKRLV